MRGATPGGGARRPGFALLEAAIVLVTIGLILAIGSSVMPWVNEEKSLETTRAVQAEAVAAVVAFSLTNHRLPCPADPALGVGDAGYGTEDCSLAVGIVPHEALLVADGVRGESHRPVVYAVYRDAGLMADLAATPPELYSGIDEPPLVLNRHDFCVALGNADPATSPTLASVSTAIGAGGCTAATFVNQAFVVADSGLDDADGDGDPFDGLNVDPEPACFASPDAGRFDVYDDLVSSVSFSALLGRVCP